ncbi:MAG: cytochrome c [Burkholderiaceae bacterium]
MRARSVLAALVLTLAFAAPPGPAAGGAGSDRAEALRGESAGDPARGAQLYESRCGGCHSADAHRIGPAHRGVFGRRAGAAAGFDYSPALRASRLVWNARTLDAWLADPERTIPGQAMGYRVDDERDRADLIAYLRDLR